MKSTLVLIILVLIFASCSDEQSTYSLEKKILIENQSYGNHIRNAMDIYLAKNRTHGTQTVIFIHGGGWKEGDKSDFEDFASAFADSGLNAVTMNYRYADALNGVGYNEMLADIDLVISHLRSNSEKFGSDFNEITLFGISAGGHLALLYAYKSGSIKGVVSLAGPTDFNDLDFLSIPGITEAINNLVGSDSFESRSDASPITHANTTATLLYHGKLDTVVPYSQSEKLYNKIASLNTENKLTLFANCGHGFDAQAIYQIFIEVMDFVKN